MNYQELLQKLRSEKPLSMEELEVLLYWMQSAHGRRSVEEMIEHEWKLYKTDEIYDYQRLLFLINQKIDSNPIKRIHHAGFHKWIHYAVEVAAVVVLVTGLTLFLNTQSKKRYQQYVETLSPEKIEIYNPKGLKTTIILPDSSIVILNANSKLSYYKDFLPNERPVYLEGEAFFEVSKDGWRPFVVHVSDATLTVLGTVFNVRAYPEDESIKTTLVSGVLRVGSQKGQRILSPGSQSSIHKVSLENEIQNIDVTEETGWLTGKLYFRQTPFPDIVATLERVFNVNIQIENQSLLQKKFTGKFEHGENIEQIFEVFKLSTPFTINHQKETNIINIL